MEITSVEYDITKRRYTMEFKKGTGTWFRFLDRQTLDDPKAFQGWLNSMIKDAK
jgi:hypothetical protein